ncbi:MAG: alpha/beta hydrolase [Alphaproteobacteria bacterium]|nr:alpha/beta hydrolase [Alphaproteobacteria bacterium]
MRAVLTSILLALLLAACADASRQAEVSVGKLDKYNSFQSEHISARDVQVWLPEGYTPTKRYAVLYMHDGQMLFDASVTWNKQEWGVDEVASRLMAEGKVRDFIVVGIFNGGESRHSDYLPEKPYRMLPDGVKADLYGIGAPDLMADEYLAFLTTELKPFIDSRYSTHKGPEHTAVMGSSMGGLISMYAIAEYPNVFGMAACLSTHWPGFSPGQVAEMPDTFIAYMRANLPTPDGHKIYFDYGDQTLDAHYPPLQAKVDALMKDLGYGPANWKTVFDPGANHSEEAWKKRLPDILRYLFGKDG